MCLSKQNPRACPRSIKDAFQASAFTYKSRPEAGADQKAFTRCDYCLAWGNVAP